MTSTETTTETTLVVSRHPAMLALLRERGIVSENAVILAHVSEGDVKSRHVVGTLPLRLAALTASITEIELRVPADRRGAELGLDELRRYAGATRTYAVREVAS
jgi:putative CRISPR-associated protein (TIGR02620 family)